MAIAMWTANLRRPLHLVLTKGPPDTLPWAESGAARGNLLHHAVVVSK